MKKLIKLLAVALAAVMCCTVFAACGNKDLVGIYTYNVSTSIFPSNWNAHQWKTDSDRMPHAYTEMGLYDVERTLDEQGYKWVNEMAAAEPVDVTAEYAENETFKDALTDEKGVVATKDRAWRIALNPNATWENGEAINADTYMESMELLLNHEYKNYRANSYYSGNMILVNARNYYNIGSDVYEFLADDKGNIVPEYEQAENKTQYMSMTVTANFAEYTFKSLASAMGDAKYFTKDGVDLLDKYTKLQNADGYIAVTDANRAELDWMVGKFISAFKGFTDSAADVEKNRVHFLFYCSGLAPEIDFSTVGIQKVDEYTIDLITQDPISKFYMMSGLTSNWIVHKKTYVDNTTTVGNLKTTAYGTKMDAYMSYGPYKFQSLQTDKEILFDRNTGWYGYTDGKHEGQYQTTRIKVDMIEDHNTAVQSFLQGKLDTVGLNSTDMTTYRYSDYLLKTDETYTWRFTFNTDEAKLAQMEANGGGTKNVNAKIVLNKNFRKAFSLSIDRIKFAQDCTAGEKASYSLLSSLYYYDIENDGNSVYRDTEQAKKAICKLYNVKYGANETYKTLDEAYASITGYDLQQAKTLLQQAWTEAKASGLVDASKGVQLEFLIPAKTMSPGLILMQDFINNSVKAMAVGTELEGKISVSWRADENAYDAIAQSGSGEYVVGYCAWGGAAFYPYNTIGVYTDPANDLNEVGFDPKSEMMSLTADFNEDGVISDDEKDVTHSLYDWQRLVDKMNAEQGGFADASFELKNTILAEIEYTLLDLAIVCPITTSTAVEMYSKKIHYFTTEYNIFAGYGGIRQMTYNMDDYDWAKFIKKSKNLSYV